MKPLLATTVATILVVLALPVVANAQNADRYQCTMGELTRRVEVMHETGVSVPCEVHYYKDSEAPGERQVLWRAMNEEGYCEAKTADFVERLEGMGWNCGTVNEVAPAREDYVPDDDMPDDTEALAPAETSDTAPE